MMKVFYFYSNQRQMQEKESIELNSYKILDSKEGV